MKKARFVIEIEYDEDAVVSSEHATSNDVKVVEYQCEGDYTGLTLAMATGIGYAVHKEQSNFEQFKEKLRLLRATGSALASVFTTMRRASGMQSVSDKLANALLAAIKKLVDLTSVGVAMGLDIDPDRIPETDSEYINDKAKNDEQSKEDTRGTDGINLDDYI